MNRRILLLVVCFGLAAFAVAEDRIHLTGKLAAMPDKTDKTVGLKLKDKTIVLAGDDEYLAAILGDERLIGKALQLSGFWKEKDKRFQVTEIFSVHDGKLHHITYWCDVCNVGASKPGPCICCLQPVDLREIPVEEKK